MLANSAFDEKSTGKPEAASLVAAVLTCAGARALHCPAWLAYLCPSWLCAAWEAQDVWTMSSFPFTLYINDAGSICHKISRCITTLLMEQWLVWVPLGNQCLKKKSHVLSTIQAGYFLTSWSSLGSLLPFTKEVLNNFFPEVHLYFSSSGFWTLSRSGWIGPLTNMKLTVE